MLKNKIATKVNLVRRGVVVDNIICCLCGVQEESTNHLFFGCITAWLVWNQCLSWLGLASAAPIDPFSNFIQFSLCKASVSVNFVLGSVWIVVVREIWNHRNKIIFIGGMVDHHEIFSLAQLNVWTWVTSKVLAAQFSFSDWCLAPMSCLNLL